MELVPHSVIDPASKYKGEADREKHLLLTSGFYTLTHTHTHGHTCIDHTNPHKTTRWKAIEKTLGAALWPSREHTYMCTLTTHKEYTPDKALDP